MQLPRLTLVACLCAVSSSLALGADTTAAPAPARAAPSPLHEPPPREALNPLYEGRTDADALKPLDEWLKRRCADPSCTLAQLDAEFRAALSAFAAERESSIRRGLDLIRKLHAERTTIRDEVGTARADGARLSALRDRWAKLPPVPRKTIVFPHVLETSGKIAARPAAPAPAVADLDADGLLDRLNRELVELVQLITLGQAELARADAHQQQAFQTVSNVLKTRHDTAKNSIGNIR